MTTPPVPKWAVDAAKAIMLADREAADWGHLQTDREVADIIAAHAPQSNEDGARLDWLLHRYSYADGRTDAPRLHWGLSNHGRAAIDAARKKDL